MKNIIEAAARRLAEIEEEKKKLTEFLNSALAVAPLLGVQTPSIQASKGPAIKSHEKGEEPAESARKRVSDNPKPEVLIPAVREILLSNGKPMTRSELHTALVGRDLEVRGVDPIKTLGTILWRASDQIESIKGEGYWPVGVAIPHDVEYLLS